MWTTARRVLSAVAWRVRATWAKLRAPGSGRNVLTTIRVRRLLVVCYGNIYRSAAAAEVLRARLAPTIEVRSAGFHLRPGRPASGDFVELARARGIDLSAHRSRLLNVADIGWADLVVLMDRQNWVRLRRLGAPAAKLLWLGALRPGPLEIADPYTMDDAEAAAVLDRVIACSRALAERLARA